MKIAVIASILASAAAFTGSPITSRHASSSSPLKMVNELEIGVTPPLGVFDPFNQLTLFPEKFERRRAVERKHGRIAMVAVVGMLVHNAGIEFPGYLSKADNVLFHDIPDGFTGIFNVPPGGLLQILLAIGFMEGAVWNASNYSGDYGTGYFGKTLQGEQLKNKLDLELNQGRAAMMGIFGAMVQEGIQGQTLAEHIASGGKIILPGII